MADRHSLIRALERGGMQTAAAEVVASEIIDIVHDNVATKADLHELDIGLRGDLQRIEAGLRADLQRLDAALRADLQRLEGETRAMELRLNNRIDRVVVQLGGAVVVVAGLLFTALHYWPPHLH
jgi:hypothetical protein